MNRRILLAVALVATTTSAFAEDFTVPEFTCLTEENGKELLLTEYPEVQLFGRTDTTRVYLAKRNGRLYRIELDACTTATQSIHRVLSES